ncbi:sulfite exporter TauE/SafE family protein [Tunicatimonas pelagia]|uniref:sulfite exporter TauE/SafE family protein n=1 Tax=Tunicatimonas pelagia TaxID=931531 RepID=UPI00266593D2|nr:sulfite exporter TauE/SafE family protein [Tunicatimonas pelagia]WKN41134.1 sulfite exporter TauE/SafE family protein [Tunicatimonas pelagia]
MIVTAFAIGLLGSFHCLGMCGPIALALPVRDQASLRRWLGRLAYNLGRITTYAFLGGLFGLLGQSLAMAGLQQTLSVALGILIVLGVALPTTLLLRVSPNHYIARMIGRVKKSMQRLFAVRTYPAMFGLGTLNGLLPCGLVYVGLAGAIATGYATEGAVYMAAFGLGTLPMMLGVSFLGQWISVPLRNKVRKAVPVLVSAVGILFILRGLSLDIPYVSPVLAGEMTVGEIITICR